MKRKEARAQSNTRKKGAVKRKNKAARKKTREQRQHQGLRERAHERKEELQQKANEETQVRGRPVRRGDIFKIVGLAAFVGIVSLVSWLVWPYIHMMFEPGGIDQVIESVRDAGPMGFLILLALQFLQIVVAFIPGEATQMAAGMLVLFLAFGNGLIGFLDDFIKVIKHRNLGLTAWQKIVLQVAVTVGFMIGLHSLGLLSTSVMFPVAGMVDLGLAYYPIAFFGIIFLVNAVNLTDGLDGLCTGVTFVSMLGYLLAGSLLGFVHVSLLAATTAGACVGFLLWNFYPAKVFMGDTGSMFFGGMVTALAFVMDRPELVLFFGIVYIWDAMTVVIQRIYFKATHGKRIFKMTPIHHAFELRGWKEVKIDGFFALIAAIGVAMGIFYICIA